MPGEFFLTGSVWSLIPDGDVDVTALAGATTKAYWSDLPATNWVSPPASSDATGTEGQMAYSDADATLFICTATDTWRWVALSEGSWP